MTALFKPKFTYCSLVWMCHRRINHSKINRKQEHCLIIIYSDETWFEALLEKDGSVSIYNRNLQLLAIGISTASKDLYPPIITELFEKKNEHQYSMRHYTERAMPAVNSVYHGTESISFLVTKIWNILPDRFKKIDSLGDFQMIIKSWNHGKFTCTLCRIYIHNASFT